MLVGQQVLRRGEVDAGLAQPDVADRLHQRGRLGTRDPQEGDIGLGIVDPLHERGEIGVLRRDAHCADDLAAATGKPLGEGGFRIVPGNEVADRGVAFFPALLGGPFADRIALLPQRERDPRDIGRDPWDGGAPGGDADQERHLCLGGQWRDRGGDRRQDDSG